MDEKARQRALFRALQAKKQQQGKGTKKAGGAQAPAAPKRSAPPAAARGAAKKPKQQAPREAAGLPPGFFQDQGQEDPGGGPSILPAGFFDPSGRPGAAGVEAQPAQVGGGFIYLGRTAGGRPGD